MPNLDSRHIEEPSTASGKKPFSRDRGLFYLLGLVAVLVIAATNAGSNLLYLVAGMTMSFAVVDIVFSRINLKGLDVERKLPPHIYAMAPAPASITLRNRKRLFPTFCVIADDHPPLDSAHCYFLHVLARNNVTALRQYRFERRGIHRLEGLRLSTRFPFGLHEKTEVREDPIDVLVYPEITDIRCLLESHENLGESFASERRGRGENLDTVREYLHDDSSNLISWKLSAKFTMLMIKEFEHERSSGVCVALDNRLLDEYPSGSEPFEACVSLAASLAQHFICLDFQVKLVTRTLCIPFGGGRAHLYRMLRALALLDTLDMTGAAEGPGKFDREVSRSARSIIISLAQDGNVELTWRTGVAGRAHAATRMFMDHEGTPRSN